MIEQRVDDGFAAVHEVDDAGREAGRFDQLEDPPHGHRGLFGGLEDDRVAAADGVRQEPQRDHRRKVEGGDGGDDAHRLADHQLVDPRRDVLEVAAEHQRRDPGGDLDVLDAAPELAVRLAEGLPAFLGDAPRDLRRVRVEQRLESKQRLDPIAGRCAAPGRERLVRSADGGVDVNSRRQRHAGETLAGRGIVHRQLLVCRRGVPVAADVVLEESVSDHAFILQKTKKGVGSISSICVHVDKWKTFEQLNV
jgi:hypothetical protein